MKHLRALRFLLLGALAVCILVGAGFAQAGDTNILDRRVTINVSAVPLGDVLETLSFENGVGVGFEESELDRQHSDYEFPVDFPTYRTPKAAKLGHGLTGVFTESGSYSASGHLITLQANELTVKEVFDLIVPQMSNYAWKEVDGLIVIYPIKGRDAVYQEFLEMKIASFSLEGDFDLFWMRRSFAAVPEVVEFLKKHNLKYSFVQVKVGEKRKLGRAVDFKNLKMIDLLSGICKIKRGGWALRQQTAKKTSEKYLDLDI